ncbi:MAG: transpeptidase family protein [Bacteroidales bacterium]|nr:transpeptidase family protein [Bacteroidales bacterium]MCF8391566.1 transpeptidase family protein [Bacteroidales bacterium]
MSVKKDIMWRVGVVYFLVVITGVMIIGKILWLQFFEHNLWSVNSESAPVKEVAINAVRGDIYSSDGKLLAVSLPFYDIRMDLTVDSLTSEVFYDQIDGLSKSLANLFRDRSWLDYKKALIHARNDKLQYYLLKRNITYDQMVKARNFPILNRGRYKGGVLFEEKSQRVKPNGYLASRTIGHTNLGADANLVGIEGAYNKTLSGTQGVKLFKRLPGNIYVPLLDKNVVDPVNGMDILTTLDLNIQDVAEKALEKQLILHNARHGTAILMEIETGDIKAIANLERNSKGGYWESVNFAIGESTVPGSTFKTASLLVALEDGLVDITDSVDIGSGIIYYSGTKVEDSHRTTTGKITVKRAFEISSNVGITKVIYDNYNSQRDKYINGLYKLGLNQKLGLEILGEGEPFIKSPDHSDWSGISLPMISFGYEIALTPMQILAFYNGIANKGKVVKPRFVKEVRYRGKTIKKYNTQVLNQKLCSEATINKLHEMLIGVVESGSARNLKNEYFKIAGKTGTAQIPDPVTGYSVKSRISYQASFVGYFPAEAPKYSCIVVVNAPSNDIYYGNLVAGPVFKEIANKIYATQLDIHQEVNRPEREIFANAPYSKSGNADELSFVLGSLGISYTIDSKESGWVSTTSGGDVVKLKQRDYKNRLVPNVLDMGLKDAVYLLESSGLNVITEGRGTVRSQSILPGSIINKGQTIRLTMSIAQG